MDVVEESQTYYVERDAYDVTRTPMMDLSVRPPRRIPPTYRASSSHARNKTSSPTAANSHDREREHGRDSEGRRPSSSRYRERDAHLETDAQDDREHSRDAGRLPEVSFGPPIAASSPPNARRTGPDRSYERQISNTTATSFSSRTSLGDSSSTIPSAGGIMARPLGLGFAPSEMDAYLGIQIACEKIAKSQGFQSDTVFRVYQEVKDLRKAEEIVVGMKRAAEKDAIERIMKIKEKNERRMSRRSGEDRDRSYDVREQEEEDDDQEVDRRTIYEEEEDDSSSPLRVEHLTHHNKRSSTSSTSALRVREGYDRPRVSTKTVRKVERDQVREGEDGGEYHPPTPTRANLWERLSRSGRHPGTALLGESLRASLSMPRYDRE